LGDGPPVIVVGGQLADRALTRPTAEELAKHFTVINYDRRGRGDSGDTGPYAVEREIQDLQALIAEVGRSASVYAHSSGAALALHAAVAGLPIAKLVLHEPPYNPKGDENLQRATRKEAEHIKTLLAEDRRGDAVEYFWRSVGMPQEMVDQVRNSPRWADLEAMAPTMAYDSEVMGDISRGGTIPADLLDAVTIPTLVLVGGASRRGEPGMDDRRGQAARRSPVERTTPRSGGPGARCSARGARTGAGGVPCRLGRPYLRRSTGRGLVANPTHGTDVD
jgi:Alpha/beta hydrolase family